VCSCPYACVCLHQMIELYLSGHLVIPNGTIHLFADGGNGVVDPSLYPLVRPGDGVYFHVAMESGACGLACCHGERCVWAYTYTSFHKLYRSRGYS
jgi:hypothetical protein